MKWHTPEDIRISKPCRFNLLELHLAKRTANLHGLKFGLKSGSSKFVFLKQELT